MTRAEEFEELRPLLFAIPYRIVGSVADAEDAVQDTWLLSGPHRIVSRGSPPMTRLPTECLSRLTFPGSQGRPTTGATPTWISQWWA